MKKIEMKQVTEMKLTVNGVEYTVNAKDVAPSMVLNNFLRDTLHLTGTKKMCFEGGCGSCIVAMEKTVDNKKTVSAVMTCLMPLFSCNGAKITTIEGLGGSTNAYHKIQKLLAENDGTQCGFCSPGMVMNMYSLNESGQKTMKEIENSFAGNLCRCTGYRPILTAFKKLASDTVDKLEDIEDVKLCPRSSRCCGGGCGGKVEKPVTCYYEVDGKKWYNVANLTDLLSILKNIGTSPYMLVGGNTAKGVYKLPSSQVYINVADVKDLTSYSLENDALTLGANMTLNRFMDIANDLSKKHSNFNYLSTVAKHIDLIASIPVRNTGTIAGNLMIKYAHNEFQSDVFLILETFKAKLVIVDSDQNTVEATPEDFLKLDMNKKIIKEVKLPGLGDSSSTYKYQSYKIMRRAQNAHAIVNAGFLLELDKNNVVKSARIIYGAIKPDFVHATKTETCLMGKNIFDNTVLNQAFATLDQELVPDYVLPDAKPECRKGIAMALFYKFILNVAPEASISSRNASGGTIFDRPVSSGVQKISPIPDNFPLTQPIHKIEAFAQTSGEAEYIADMPDLPNQLHAAFVLAKAPANSVIDKIDTTAALAADGVVAFFGASDIPGKNTFMPALANYQAEELFCSGTVQYYNQPVGIVVGSSYAKARAAAALVKVTFKASPTKPLLTIQDVLAAGDEAARDRISLKTSVTASRKGTDIVKTIKGTFDMGQQYHFHMEVQCANVVPTEDGLEIYPSSQCMDLSQLAAAEALDIPTQKISIIVRRLGGAFGAKLSRNALPSTAAALAAYKLQRPVKIWMPLKDNMSAIGKRYPAHFEYEVSVNAKGVIQSMNSKLYDDLGVGVNEQVDWALVPCFKSCYDTSTWNFTTYTVKTDTPANCFTRAPGSLEAIAGIESIMEHIAYELGLDRFDVKLANLDETKNKRIIDFWKTMKSWSEVETKIKELQQFNKENRWKKRGASVVPMNFEMVPNIQYPALVSIIHGDGGVMISHGGIEMGQGVNTKAAQVCAYKLGLPLDKIAIRPAYNVIAPNAFGSGGSLTSESICYAVAKACDILLERMSPIKRAMGGTPTWAEWVNKCYASNVQLTVTAGFNPDDPDLGSYSVFGLCFTEVEVDILTGQHQILNVDILEDVGESISPLIDIGQTEGGFVMGIGYFMTEEIVMDDEGDILTNRTWSYKPPGAKDIPLSFRIDFPGSIPNPVGVLRNKAVAEPAMCLAAAVPLAVRHALSSAREEADAASSKWVPFEGTTTTENIFMAALNDYKQFVL